MALTFGAETAAAGGSEVRAVEAPTRRVVGEAVEMGTVRDVAVTLAEEGVTVVEERIFVTGSSGTIPRAALSSADLRIARLMCAVAVAGRKLGAGEEETAATLGLGTAGVSFLAGVRGLEADLDTASVFLWVEVCWWAVVEESCLVEEETFLVVLEDLGLVDEETFFVASEATFLVEEGLAWEEAATLVSLVALVALSAEGLVLDVEEGFVVDDVDGLVLELLTLGFEDGAAGAA